MAVSRNRPPDLTISLPERLAVFLAERQLGTATCQVALSGGCDSVSLLHLLLRLRLPAGVAAVHVHHGLSPNADAWAAFCQDLCAQWAVPLQVLHVQVSSAGEGLGDQRGVFEQPIPVWQAKPGLPRRPWWSCPG